MKMGNTKHLTIIGILGVIFFTLIFLSTSSSGISSEYSFNDIEITILPTYDSQILLGNVKIENNGFVPKRVFLDQFVICQLSDTFGDATYTINYKGNTQKEYVDVFSGSYNYQSYVEVSAGKNIELEIIPEMYKYDFYDKIKLNNLNQKTVPFYVFKVENDGRNTYDYCSSVKKEDAYKIINVKINVSESELNNDGTTPTKTY